MCVTWGHIWVVVVFVVKIVITRVVTMLKLFEGLKQ